MSCGATDCYKRGNPVTLIRSITVLGVLAVFLAGCGDTSNRGGVANTKQLRALIDSNIPSGSTGSQVKAFLGEHGFQYSDEIQSQSAIFAVAPLSPKFQLVKMKFQVAFHFDKTGKLRDYTVTHGLVGP
jgi:hypothetical protein